MHASHEERMLEQLSISIHFVLPHRGLLTVHEEYFVPQLAQMTKDMKKNMFN